MKINVVMKSRDEISNAIFSMLSANERLGMELWKREYPSIWQGTTSQLPLVSILATAYNSDKHIANAIESVLYQTYPNVELILVIDPSTDNTISVVKEYETHNNLIIIENKNHLGIIGSYNEGLKYCKGKYIARMDMDDLIHPQRLEKQVSWMEANPEVDVVSSWMKIFDETGATKDVTYRSDQDLIRITMVFYSPLSHAASIFKSEVLKTIGYREGYKSAEDYDLWVRMLKRYHAAVFPEYLYLYRTHSNQVTNEKNIQAVKNSWHKIGSNILGDLLVSYTEVDLCFHVEYVMYGKKVPGAAEFMQWSEWLQKILVANKITQQFNSTKFCSFVFNLWQSYYEQYRKQLTFLQKVKLLFSPFNLYGMKRKTKDFLLACSNR